MNYKNAKEVLPPSLVIELQKYLQGEIIYIPKNKEERAAWGELSGTRKQIARRNEEIYILHMKGLSTRQLEEKYHLSGESIRKIILKVRGLEKAVNK